jgi:hypothetical protein
MYKGREEALLRSTPAARGGDARPRRPAGDCRKTPLIA